jgi:ABC-type dipeptide/oligopeptide/nickel transport system permease subunit
LVGVLWGAIAGYFGGAPETVMISYLGLGIPPPQ